MMLDEIIYVLALSSNSYIGPKRYTTIKNSLGLKDFFSLSAKEQMEFLKIRSAKAVPEFERMLFEGEKILKVCNKIGIKFVRIEDEFYPPALKEIEDPPFLLYYLGHFNHSIKKIAVIGTRHPSKEAIEINKYFSREFVSYGIGVVSGLARGHDSIAQRTVVENDGYTIAVMGGGVDVIYPLENKNLYYQIREKGCIVSEYPPGTYPLKQNFPLRNRIISGLSDAVLVLQAPEKSGTLITVECAQRQNRDVYTIPGNTLDPLYRGSNKLIQNGAKIALTPEDIVFDLLGKDAKKIRNIKNDLSLSDEEKLILKSISKETHIDDLIEKSGISQQNLLRILTLLEIRGYVEQLPGGFYRVLNEI
jgi:DNA processing protein